MYLKTLIIAALSFCAIGCANIQKKEVYLNKSVPVNLEEVTFRSNGMFLTKDAFNEIRISYLGNEGNDYIAFYRVYYRCGNCKARYDEDPGLCEVCGSSDIREIEIDLWPVS